MKVKFPSSSRSSKSDEEKNVFTVCKKILKMRVFQGCYQERRYVGSLNVHRDLVVIDDIETDLKADLEYIRNVIVGFYQDPLLWVGVTLPEMAGTPAGICIWTVIEKQSTGYGHYWFVVESICFEASEVLIKIKPIREITLIKPSPDNKENNIGSSNANPDNQVNSFDALHFILCLLTTSLEFLKFLGEFSLQFLAEMRMWLHVGTPVILKIFDLVVKIVCGFFILLAMIFGFNRQRHSNNTIRYRVSPYY